VLAVVVSAIAFGTPLVLAGLGELHGLQTALLGQLEILMQKA